MQLSIEQHAAIIAWAEKTPEVRAVLLYGSRAKGRARDDSDVDLALSMNGPEPGWRLSNFISHRCEWTAELEKALGLVVQLELADRESADAVPEYVETGHIVLWQKE